MTLSIPSSKPTNSNSATSKSSTRTSSYRGRVSSKPKRDSLSQSDYYDNLSEVFSQSKLKTKLILPGDQRYIKIDMKSVYPPPRPGPPRTNHLSFVLTCTSILQNWFRDIQLLRPLTNFLLPSGCSKRVPEGSRVS